MSVLTLFHSRRDFIAGAWGVFTSQIPVMAAALSYRTIFGLIPVLVVGLVVLGAFASDEQVGETVRSILSYSGINDLVIEGGATLSPDMYGPEPYNVETQRLDEWIATLVDRVRTIPFRTIGFIGVLALIYAALSMLVEVEGAFNRVYRAPAGRSWGARIARYWTMLTLGTLLLCATFFVSGKVQVWVAKFSRGEVAMPFQSAPPDSALTLTPTPTPAVDAASIASAAGEGEPLLVKIAGYLVTVIISTALLLTLYMTVPNTYVQVRAAAVGAIFAAVLWEAGKWGFAEYLSFSASYSRLYGSIAIIPLFMLWIYVTWIVVLTGLHMSYLVQTYKNTPLSETAAVAHRPTIVDPASILIVYGVVAERFAAGKTSDQSDLSAATGIDGQVVTTMLERLAEAGLLHRLHGGDDRAGFTLAKPSSMTPPAEVLRIGSLMALPGGEGKYPIPAGLAALVKAVDAARLAAIDGAMFPDRSPDPVKPPVEAAMYGETAESDSFPRTPADGPVVVATTVRPTSAG